MSGSERSRRGASDDGPVGVDELPGAHRNGHRGPASWVKSALAVLISLAIVVGGGYFAFTKGRDLYRSFTNAEDYSGSGGTAVTVTIPSGATATQMGSILLDADVIASQKAWDRAVSRNPSAISSVQAAQYSMVTQVSAADALSRLADPSNIVQNRFTVPEGLRNTLVVQRIAEQTGVSADELTAVLASPGELGLPDWSRGATEGFLFPNTYTYDDSRTATSLLRTMTTQFGTVTGQLDFVARAQAMSVDPYDALTIASIIEREVHRAEDRPKVARVIYNRLATGMKLQMDSTVKYALPSSQGTDTTIDETQYDSPYNTYRYAGLPPGAISNPGQDSLSAAVNPADGNWIYFVTVNLDTGETLFTNDYAEHERNVQQYRDWCNANSGRCTS